MQVLIEGSVLPSTYLAKGERRLVELTPFINKLIRQGYVTVIETIAPAPPPVKTRRRKKAPEPVSAPTADDTDTPPVDDGAGSSDG